MARKVKATLDPEKEVASFSAEHVSIVDQPGNKKEFIMINDDHSMSLWEAVAESLQILGPMIDLVRAPQRDAILALSDYLRGRLSSEMDKMLSSEDGHMMFPSPSEVSAMLNSLSSVPELPEQLTVHVDIIRDFIESCGEEAWELDEGRVLCSAKAVKKVLSAKVVERTIAGKEVNSIAILANAIDDSPGEAILIERDTALWGLVIDETDEDLESTAEVDSSAEVNPDEEQPGSVEENDSSENVESSIDVNSGQEDSEGVSDKELSLSDNRYEPIRRTFDEMISQFTTHDLTEEERFGIFRYYVNGISEQLQAIPIGQIVLPDQPQQSQENSNQQMAEVIKAVISEVVAPLRTEIEALKRSIPEATEYVPQRRSMGAAPHYDPNRGGYGNNGVSPRELAQRGL